jgi:hypothetical protein
MLQENESDSIYLMKVPLIVYHIDDLHDGKSLGKAGSGYMVEKNKNFSVSDVFFEDVSDGYLKHKSPCLRLPTK